MKKKVIAATLALTAALSFTAFAGEWKQDDKGWWYQNDDGSYIANQWFQDFDGAWYYFNAEGYSVVNTVQDGKSLDASGRWVEPVTGDKDDILDDINSWIISEVWNGGFCNFYHYEEDGLSYTGDAIDIEFAYTIFKEEYKKKAGYDAYINSLPEEHYMLKMAWNEMSEESDKLYKYYAENGIHERGDSVDTSIFVQYRNSFTDFVYDIIY